MSRKLKSMKKRTKIVATLGPACVSPGCLEEMMRAGVNVFRINFSHYKPDDTVKIIRSIREISERLAIPIALLGDIRGPHIRVGDVTDGQIFLKEGSTLVLTPEPMEGTTECVSVSYDHLADDVETGNRILLDNGTIILEVDRVEQNCTVHCHVVQGGVLSSRRGINLPGRKVSLPPLTEKDYEDVEFAIANELDFLALSFVQTADDIRLLKDFLTQRRVSIPIIAKIENHSALANMESIAQETYGVMVARGDLALEMSIQDIPIAQKHIITICRQAAVPVITATQMLESMISSPVPTRAEATDIANAILDGTDALMLSGETAIGQHPVETVRIMSRIATRTEEAWLEGKIVGPSDLDPSPESDSTIAYASTVIASSLGVGAILTHTTTGSTARRVSKHRPSFPILALTSFEQTRKWLALSWGVESALVEDVDDINQLISLACQEAVRTTTAEPGDTVVLTAGMPLHESGKTNLIRVAVIPD